MSADEAFTAPFGEGADAHWLAGAEWATACGVVGPCVRTER